MVASQPLSALLATAHEWGHSLYEQGLPRSGDHAFPWPLGDATSMGVHESQSLFWECRVGRSQAFAQRLEPRGRRSQSHQPRASHMEVETRIAEAQLWIAQRLPLAVIREKAAQNWGITNIKTISKYLALARQRMVQELLTDRRRHQAEQIFALNECARRAMEAEQFNAAVGAFRVIAEIGGLLRAPIKPPEPRT